MPLNSFPKLYIVHELLNSFIQQILIKCFFRARYHSVMGSPKNPADTEEITV